MTKASDVDDLLGDTPTTTTTKTKKAAAPAAKKAAAPAAKKAAAPAPVADPAPASKPAAKKAAAPAPVAEDKPKRVKEPVVFEEGERDALIKRIKSLVKKPINSKDLAVKLDIATRKLRRVLYSAQKQGFVSLELGASPSAGMSVSPAA